MNALTQQQDLTLAHRLQPFCSEDERRAAIMRPFRCGAHVVATNGRIAIRILSDEEFSSNGMGEKGISDIFGDFKDPQLSWKPMSDLKKELDKHVVTKFRCEECEGEGRVKYVYEGTYTEDEIKRSCPYCDGKGYFDSTTEEVPEGFTTPHSSQRFVPLQAFQQNLKLSIDSLRLLVGFGEGEFSAPLNNSDTKVIRVRYNGGAEAVAVAYKGDE